ncbi:MAG: hypothetical protein AMXMBFR33_71660 [Candidatus Xenobia bacterium]
MKPRGIQVDAGLIFGMAGVLLLALAMLFLYLAYRVSQWPRVQATVVQSHVVSPSEGKYRAQIQVRYRLGEQDRERELDCDMSSSIHSLIQGIVDHYPEGGQVDLPVNPSDPSDVRMAVTWGWTDLFIPVVLGVLGLIFLAIPWAMTRFLREDSSPRSAGLVLVAAGLLFLAVGGLLAWTKLQILSWPTAQARVLESEVQRRGRAKFSLRLVLEYEALGRTYRSLTGSRFSTSDRAGLERWKEQLAPESQLTVRFMPGDPGVVNFEAAPTPGYFLECWLVALVGLATVLLGWTVGRFLKGQ